MDLVEYSHLQRYRVRNIFGLGPYDHGVREVKAFSAEEALFLCRRLSGWLSVEHIGPVFTVNGGTVARAHEELLNELKVCQVVPSLFVWHTLHGGTKTESL